MNIWVDADSCPGHVKKIVNNAASRLKIKAIFVTSVDIYLPKSIYISTVKVKPGKNAVDDRIIGLVEEGDIVITTDVPLASHLVNIGTTVINPRGDLYTKDTIGERLSMRNLNEQLRDNGIYINSSNYVKRKGIKQFSEIFDRELTKAVKKAINRK